MKPRNVLPVIITCLFLFMTIFALSANAAQTVTIEGIPMILIPEGTFQMGSADGGSNEQPVHTVTMDTFYMGESEITNTQYAAFLNEALAAGTINASATTVSGKTGPYTAKEYIYLDGEYNEHNQCWIHFSDNTFTIEPGKENLPVVFVTWYGAKAYAERYGFDLPTEAEWEYAARAGQQLTYATDNGTISTSKANYNFTSGRVLDIKSYPPNPFGFYDMAGNVTELCLDWYDSYTSDSVSNPIGGHTGTLRAVRGGNWQTSQNTCRTAYRMSVEQTGKSAHTGFRVVRRVYRLHGSVLEQGMGLSGVSVRIAGGEIDETLTTDGLGNYQLVLYETGTYQITPSKIGYQFVPFDTEVTVTELDTYADDFTAIPTPSSDPITVEGIRFMYIPPGSFTMGSDTDQLSERPAHTVTMDAYYLSDKEITNAQYTTYLNAALAAGTINVVSGSVKAKSGQYTGMELIDLNGTYNINNECWINYADGSFTVETGKENMPVTYVTWYGAMSYADYYGFTLPTEAEWEYAARGGQQYRYGTNNGTITENNANYDNKVGRPTAVGSYPANPFGLFDMSGNISEVCIDWYDSYTAGKVHNPVGPHIGDNRAVRGGNWQSTADPCRASFRYSTLKTDKSHLFGFRVARHIRILEGRVVESGVGLPDVTISLSGYRTSLTATTDSDGKYVFQGLNDGSYILTPSKESYTFKPLSIEAVVDEMVVTAQQIEAFPEGASQTIDIDGISCVLLSEGVFLMGSNSGGANEQPVHEVTLDAFYISETEITNELYVAYLNSALSKGVISVADNKVLGVGGEYNGMEYLFLGGYYNAYNKCWITYSNGTFSVTADKEKLPVTYVSWYGAKAFADFYGFTLPTEAEWEYAAKGGVNYIYGTDDGTIDSDNANFNSNNTTVIPVKTYGPNPFGLYDMAGNVAELCLDWYDTYTSGSVTNPVGPHTGENRAVRGGSFKSDANACRTSYRISTILDGKSYLTGFRVVRHIMTLQGRVAENDSGIQGVVVTATANEDGASYSATTDDDGIYRIMVYTTGAYTLSPSAAHYLFNPGQINMVVDEAFESVNEISANLLEPPSEVILSDVPGDHGHRLIVSWTLSPDDGIVSHYNIYRSRNPQLTDPVDISSYSTIAQVKAAELTTTILIASVGRGTTSYDDKAVPVAGATYYYWLQASTESVSSSKVAAQFATNVETVPLEFSVSAPYPNPFNPATTIDYTLPAESIVRLVVYDVLGREVAVLRDGVESAGVHSAVWDGRDGDGVPAGSGIYIYRLTAGKYRSGGKMMLMR